MSGTPVFFNFLCVSNASHADGRISECASFVPLKGQRAGKCYRCGESPLSDLPGKDDYALFLSSDAEYGKKIKNNGRGPGNQRISLRIRK